jgi:predicted nucleotidyltransferase
MDKKSIKVAKKFLNKIKDKFSIEKLILFGSRARGDNFEESDYDFLIISDEFKKIPFIFRSSNFYDYWNQKEDFEIICYTNEEFNKKKHQQSIVKKAIMEGIEIK